MGKRTEPVQIAPAQPEITRAEFLSIVFGDSGAREAVPEEASKRGPADPKPSGTSAPNPKMVIR